MSGTKRNGEDVIENVKFGYKGRGGTVSTVRSIFFFCNWRDFNIFVCL